MRFPRVLVGLALLLSACVPATTTPTDTPTVSNTPAPGATLTSTNPPIATPVAANEDRSGCVITAPPDGLGIDPAYAKYCDANGIPIIALEPVSDKAVRQAYYLTVNFFAPIPAHLAQMIENGAMLAIYGENQTVRDIPETYTFSLSNTPYAVGLGGHLSQPVTVTHESDLNGRWRPCNRVTVHELGHALRDIVLLTNVPGFLSLSNGTFADGLTKGLWEGAYASTNADENWAEGVNAYFGVFRDSSGNNYARNRDELAEYDPALFSLVDSIFKGFEWQPSCP